jgi:general secretion pathway protein L
MPNKLFLRPKQALQTSEPVFEWALYDLSQRQMKYGAQDSLESIDQTLMQNGIENTELIFLWPSNAAFATKISLPGNQNRFIQQALPFAVEEQLAQDIDKVHIVLGEKNAKGEFFVVNIDRDLFSFYFDLLSDVLPFYSLKGIYLDSDLLPMDDESLVICISNDVTLLKNKDLRSVRTSTQNLLPYLDSLFLGQVEEDSDANEPFSIMVYIEESAQDSATLLIAQIEQYPNISIEKEIIQLSEFELICQNQLQHGAKTLNLCQGDYKVQSDKNSHWKKWRAVALIAGIGFLLQLGVFIGKGMHYDQKANAIGLQALAEYQKIAPNSSRVTVENLPRIIQGKLNQKNVGQPVSLGFFALLGETGFQYQQSKDKQKLKFNSINFNQQRGELLIEMRAESYGQLERLQKSIVSAGLAAKISSAVQEKEFFRGRISVTGS